jgi:hypothetical protein
MTGGGQFHFHPGSYLELMTSELPDYYRLLLWLRDAGLDASVVWTARDLVVIVGTSTAAG